MTAWRRSPAITVLLWLPAVIWAWFASGVRTFTRPAEVLTAIPAAVVLLLTLRPSAQFAGDAKRGGFRWQGVTAWLVVLLDIVGWELAMLFSQPRKSHPTLSSILDSLLSTHPSRFLGYLIWLTLGWLLVRDLTRRSASADE